ncbi:MAG: hypothetical protein LBT01_05010, partial [Spirochaetaceae bacterium]|nr:hypothetical protein [Spirochaetaceae bacterium]
MLLAAHSVVKALSEDAFFSLKARLRPPVAALPRTLRCRTPFSNRRQGIKAPQAPVPRTLLFNTDEEDGTDGKVCGKEYVGSVCA